jgi:hypothetical protein
MPSDEYLAWERDQYEQVEVARERNLRRIEAQEAEDRAIRRELSRKPVNATALGVLRQKVGSQTSRSNRSGRRGDGVTVGNRSAAAKTSSATKNASAPHQGGFRRAPAKRLAATQRSLNQRSEQAGTSTARNRVRQAEAKQKPIGGLKPARGSRSYRGFGIYQARGRTVSSGFETNRGRH